MTGTHTCPGAIGRTAPAALSATNPHHDNTPTQAS